MPAAIQLLPVFTSGDAISDYARLLARVFQERGLKSIILAEGRTAETKSEAGDVGEVARILEPDSVLIYHHSTGSDLVDEFCSARAGRKYVIYHNITPPRLLTSMMGLAARSNRGLQQLSVLAESEALAVADSEFNAAELRRAGFPQVSVLPISLPNARREALQAAAARRVTSDHARFLYVGRLVPHKRVEDAIRAFAVYQEQYDANARVRIVGGKNDAPEYVSMLEQTCQHVNGVTFMGKLVGEPLFSEYGNADFLLQLSEHEGFCVPLIEAMAADLVVLARAAAAVPETLDGCAIAFETAEPEPYAEAAHYLMHNQAQRDAVLVAQRRRLDAFTEEKFRGQAVKIFLP